MPRILITGAKGQLGTEFFEAKDTYAKKGYVFIFTDIDELDITNSKQLEQFFTKNQFDVIINCAAYTNVDKAEEEYNKAYKLNVLAIQNLAKVANTHNSLLIHFSTDFIFDGTKSTPISEEDVAKPLSVYGRTKYLGEQELLWLAKKAVIFRISWLYSPFGKNFVSSMRHLGANNEVLNVIFDQVGAPTYAPDIVHCILDNLQKFEYLQKPTIFNFSNEGVTSWYDFAHAIMEFSGLLCQINPIRTEEYPLPAKRPSFSLLDKTKIKKFTNKTIPYWQDSLRLCIERMEDQEMDR